MPVVSLKLLYQLAHQVFVARGVYYKRLGLLPGVTRPVAASGEKRQTEE